MASCNNIIFHFLISYIYNVKIREKLNKGTIKDEQKSWNNLYLLNIINRTNTLTYVRERLRKTITDRLEEGDLNKY